MQFLYASYSVWFFIRIKIYTHVSVSILNKFIHSFIPVSLFVCDGCIRWRREHSRWFQEWRWLVKRTCSGYGQSGIQDKLCGWCCLYSRKEEKALYSSSLLWYERIKEKFLISLLKLCFWIPDVHLVWCLIFYKVHLRISIFPAFMFLPCIAAVVQ